MCTAKKEARLLLIDTCNDTNTYIAMVFRGPYRVEYVILGDEDIIDELKKSTIFDEIRYVWPEKFSKKLGIRKLTNLSEYFGSCTDCIKAFIESLCNLSNNLIVSNASLLFRLFRENDKRSCCLGERATG